MPPAKKGGRVPSESPKTAQNRTATATASPQDSDTVQDITLRPAFARAADDAAPVRHWLQRPHALALVLLDAYRTAGARLYLDDERAIKGAGQKPPQHLREVLRELVGSSSADDSDHWAKHPARASVAPPSAEEREKWRRASAGYRAMVAVLRAPDRGCREVLGMPIAHARGLPVPWAVRFLWAGGKDSYGDLPTDRVPECVVTTSRAAHEAARKAGAAAFQLSELEAMAAALEAGRAGPSDFMEWLEGKVNKGRAVGPELTRVAELPGFDPEKGAQTSLTFGELFDGLGLEVVAVELHPKAEASAAPGGDGGAAAGGEQAKGKEVSGW